MATIGTLGVACSWLIWVSGCALQSEAETSDQAQAVAAKTDALRRKSTPAPPPAPSSEQPVASSSSACTSGVPLAPTVTPPGYRLSTLTVGIMTTFILVPDASAQAVPLPAGYRVECLTTSDGERFVQLIPPSSPTVAVDPGGQCGVVNQQGALLQCVVGSTCLSAGDNQPGICQPYASAPISPL